MVQDFGILDFRTSAVIAGMMNKPIFGEPVFQQSDAEMSREVAFNDLNMVLSDAQFGRDTRDLDNVIKAFGS